MVTKSDYGLGPLYHGTSKESADAILIGGLLVMGGQPIWLSYSQQEALENAQEKEGPPVVLEVNLPDGWLLERGEAGTYLSWRDIPHGYIQISIPAPTGTCYHDAWQYVMRHVEAQPVLVHCTVHTLSGQINHAWVELPDGTVWDTASKVKMPIEKYYSLVDPIVEDRYTVDEAATMLNVGYHGPWTAEERMKHIGR